MRPRDPSPATPPSAEAAADADPATLIRAIERAAERLRGETLPEADALPLARSILDHARHARSNVRQAVARAALHLPEDPFEEVIAILLADPNQYVKRDATRSYDERSRRRRAVRVQDESSADLRAVRARLATSYGESVAREAERLRDLALAQFVERFHHELVKIGTPLRLEMNAVLDHARRAHGEALTTHATQASAMLDILLDLARAARAHAHATAATPRYRDENLRALALEHVALLTARVGDERRARLHVETEIDAALSAEIDRGLFGQALSNLLQNAVESYPAENAGPIHVRVVAEGRKGGTLVALCVEDRGRGIPEDVVSRLGEPFVSSKGGGRGLGLLNVRKMIEGAHGGSVAIQSELGRGTTVSVEVPRRQ